MEGVERGGREGTRRGRGGKGRWWMEDEGMTRGGEGGKGGKGVREGGGGWWSGEEGGSEGRRMW